MSVSSAPVSSPTKPDTKRSAAKQPRTLLFCGERLPMDVTKVDCRDGDVEDISPLANLHKLRVVVLTGTSVRDLSALAEATGVEVLIVAHTLVDDLTPLRKMQRLRVLHLGSTPVTDLAPLAHQVELEELYIERQEVSDLSPLRGMVKLRRLEVMGTAVTDLAPLSALTEIEMLNLTETPVADVRALSSMSKLTWLNLERTQVSNLRPLFGLPLKELLLRGTPVSRYMVRLLRKAIPNLYLGEAPLPMIPAFLPAVEKLERRPIRRPILCGGTFPADNPEEAERQERECGVQNGWVPSVP